MVGPELVILSNAKDLVAQTGCKILRFAQNDVTSFGMTLL